jgi:hypothetical protein
MYDNALKQMQECIRTRRYVMTLHAEEEMDDDDLSIFDIERGILTGKIIKRQRDHETEEWKHLIEGQTLTDEEVIIVAKLSNTGKLVMITVYLA